ncbi:MAG: NAD-dependent epimerase/dehydratase family protein, partial [Actinomycetota bacterium]
MELRVNPTRQRILVTGGCGFIGRPLIERLRRSGYEVSVFDDLSRGTAVEGVALHRGDIRDSDAVQTAVRSVRPDVIFHLAAMHFIPDCNREP